MIPFDEAWVTELRQQAQSDPSFSELHSQLVRLEPQCKRIIASLPPEQQKAMQDYIDIEQQMDVWLTLHAHISGIQVGQRRSKLP